jgi:hypothetical protein
MLVKQSRLARAVIQYTNAKKGSGVCSLTPAPLAKPSQSISYLDFLTSFFFFVVILLSFSFSGMQPQPQRFFFSAIFITSFLWIAVHRFGCLVDR